MPTICTAFLLTRPYGRDLLTVSSTVKPASFYSHAHTGVISQLCDRVLFFQFLLTRPYGRDPGPAMIRTGRT